MFKTGKSIETKSGLVASEGWGRGWRENGGHGRVMENGLEFLVAMIKIF